MNSDLLTAEPPRFDFVIPDDLDKRLAFHQAGHAVAICLGNKQRKMPEVYFQIAVTHGAVEYPIAVDSARSAKKYQAKIEGGRLIQNVPFSFPEATRFYSKAQSEGFFRAFEADVINLLAGPIAEAKYVAGQDDEIFTRNLINLTSLNFYSGKSDLNTISEYMHCFVVDESKRSHKLTELFNMAFNFVDKKSNWCAISAIADLILGGTVNIINCEDIASLLKCA